MATIPKKTAVALVVMACSTAMCLAPSAAFATATNTSSSQFAAHGSAVPGLAPPGSSSSAVYYDLQGRQISEGGGMPYATGRAGSKAQLATCTPVSGRDDPHYTSGDVSGHGWWGKGNCSGSTATVYNCLYEYWTDNSWRQKACSPRKKLLPGTGGSVQRTNARARCNPTAGLVDWRNHVDVDVDGTSDTGEWPYNQTRVVCVVY